MIRTEALARTFTRGGTTVEAVRGLDLQVARGELVALLGPNGAGKSTTLRMLTTLLAPTSGRASVAGHDVVADPRAVRRRTGYVGQGNGAGHHQRGRDELVGQARVHGLGRAEARRRADELVAALDLGAVVDRRVGTLSGGQRRRLDVALGLVGAPDVLFLDEPSTGLDPHNRAALQEHVRALRSRRDTTVVLTTHYLDEADALAERVVVVDHGRVIADDTPARLKAELAGDRLVLRLGDADAAARAAGRLRAAGAGEVEADGAQVRARLADAPALVPRLLHDLEAAGAPVASVEVSRPTLDDVFLRLTGRSLREGGAGTPTSHEEAAA
ncbi:ATP-binding cassette domain-containing protein [Vallicoccus soli]|uniref:ATP-binding cassette domain-containing protein n=1 Tax=Vallicoccus soli TaxID=2339232 RepID=A0A3A3ZK52_9ACTN|nr:ATP-binding cassette domain-containing protein [Vallicoccus soli]